jgi:hypothetical protein
MLVVHHSIFLSTTLKFAIGKVSYVEDLKEPSTQVISVVGQLTGPSLSTDGTKESSLDRNNTS